MMYQLLLRDLSAAVVTVNAARGKVTTGLTYIVLNRSASALAQFRVATPIDTGAMVLGWRQAPYGLGGIEISNEVNRKGFSYPSAQITGTGSRGRPVAGFTGAFNLGWPGHGPNSQLRAVWESQISQPFAVGSLF